MRTQNRTFKPSFVFRLARLIMVLVLIGVIAQVALLVYLGTQLDYSHGLKGVITQVWNGTAAQ